MSVPNVAGHSGVRERILGERGATDDTSIIEKRIAHRIVDQHGLGTLRADESVVRAVAHLVRSTGDTRICSLLFPERREDSDRSRMRKQETERIVTERA